MYKFSIIIPVYNRPDEIQELLESLSNQRNKNFEIIIIEDGSKIDCKHIIEKYQSELTINYSFKENTGPAKTRNLGAQKAIGEYLVFFDSDCIIPKEYFEIVENELSKNNIDVWGGPDSAHPSFSNLQKAINHSMTSFFTTGKIRGGEKIDKFHPRSFNMGIKKKVFDDLGGFPITRMWPGEDMVFSVELIKRGFSTMLFKDAKVFHKRRNTLKSFSIQVFRFGKTRYIISKVYPKTFKIFFLFPSLFLVGNLFLISMAITVWWSIIPICIYIFLVFFEALFNKNKFFVAILSILTSYIQLFAYGYGFIFSIFNGDEYNVFKNGFYPEKK
jgi:glycosyltransferase involved in cell wall biosynthesis